MQDSDQQITALELTLMEHERLLDQYSELIRDHQSQIDRLKKQLDLLAQKLSKYEQPDDAESGDERPPHY